jgi:4-alpha-glucanotransferase
MAVLRALGAPVHKAEDVAAALRERKRELWLQPVDPVIVAWRGEPCAAELRLREGVSGVVECSLRLEEGDSQRWAVALDDLPVTGRVAVDGDFFVGRCLPLPAVPDGYHDLRLEVGADAHCALLISAPPVAYVPDGWQSRWQWGVFLPLYALCSERSWGAGDLADMGAFLDWLDSLGGSALATLPILATAFQYPSAPSPYTPSSRLLWNEFYVDVAGAPGLEGCGQARQVITSPSFRDELQRLRANKYVDYERAAALKRRVLAELAHWSFSQPALRQSIEAFVRRVPVVREYARFRATAEKLRLPWRRWPERPRSGRLDSSDYDPQAERYHLYVQWLAEEQLSALVEKTRKSGSSLYFDLPLGVHEDGFDVWKERGSFAEGVSGGAPPDSFFRGGQDWGFPPLHPGNVRQARYGYVIASLRHLMAKAGILRIDHVMGLHRLFWIPHGADAKDGVYVRYPAEELYAIICLESHRNRTVIVGEDLGTVPLYVRQTMKRRNVHRSWVLQFELPLEPKRRFRPAPLNSVASVGTHDTPMFAAYWENIGRISSAGGGPPRRTARDRVIELLRARGVLERGRRPTRQEALRACLRLLAASSSPLVLISLEDLWLEKEPQNVPGTWKERPNWRRKARYSLEEIRTLSEVTEALREVNEIRSGRLVKL